MKQLFCFISLTMLLCNCGVGMIGLFPDEKGNLLMDKVYTLEQGCSYVVEVVGYYESGIIIDYSELNVWKKCQGWSEMKKLDNPYTGIIEDSLHSEYTKLLKGE